MASSDFWRNLAIEFRAVPDAPTLWARWDCIAGSGSAGKWLLIGSRAATLSFDALARRAAVGIADAGTSDLLTAWLEGLKRQGLGFKFANPNVYKTPDGTGTVRYLTGEIRGLCEVSANFCKTLESRALQSEFERKKHDQESVKALASRQFEAIKRTLELRSERKEQTPEALAVDALPQLEPTEKGMPTKKVRKKYPRGFNGLQGKHADMSGYLALVDLTPRQRECYSLRKEYNLPLTEVAARLGIDRKTAYEHINQAEKRMRLQLEKRRDRSGRIKIPRIAE